MRFDILGPLEAHDGERRLELGGSRQRRLLAILLVNRNELVSADRLIEDLWGGEPPPTAAKSLQAHVSRLRKALGGNGRVLTQSGGYTLAVGPDDVDATRFERLFADGRERFAAGDAEGAAAGLADALRLWHGRPLAEY